jgi:hypothetical protein
MPAGECRGTSLERFLKAVPRPLVARIRHISLCLQISIAGILQAVYPQGADRRKYMPHLRRIALLYDEHYLTVYDADVTYEMMDEQHRQGIMEGHDNITKLVEGYEKATSDAWNPGVALMVMCIDGFAPERTWG